MMDKLGKEIQEPIMMMKEGVERMHQESDQQRVRKKVAFESWPGHNIRADNVGKKFVAGHNTGLILNYINIFLKMQCL